MRWRWPEAAGAWKNTLEKNRPVLLIVAVGILLLLLPAGGKHESGTAEERGGESGQFDLESFEEKLGKSLSQIEGAGSVQVVLSLDGGSCQILARDLEREADGSSKSTVVTLGRGSGTQEAIPLQTVAPQFRGALVVCPGGGDNRIRLELVEAVSALTGLGADRITVCRGNS